MVKNKNVQFLVHIGFLCTVGLEKTRDPIVKNACRSEEIGGYYNEEYVDHRTANEVRARQGSSPIKSAHHGRSDGYAGSR